MRNIKQEPELEIFDEISISNLPHSEAEQNANYSAAEVKVEEISDDDSRTIQCLINIKQEPELEIFDVIPPNSKDNQFEDDYIPPVANGNKINDCDSINSPSLNFIKKENFKKVKLQFTPSCKNQVKSVSKFSFIRNSPLS